MRRPPVRWSETAAPGRRGRLDAAPEDTSANRSPQAVAAGCRFRYASRAGVAAKASTVTPERSVRCSCRPAQSVIVRSTLAGGSRRLQRRRNASIWPTSRPLSWAW